MKNTAEAAVSNGMHKLAVKTGLKVDIEIAFKAGQSDGSVLHGTWLNMLDPESYQTLISIWEMADGSYSLNTLAMAILRNKKIYLA